MSRPRFLADQNLVDAIVQGVVRREPTVEFTRLRSLGLEGITDEQVLQFAAQENYIVVSHDVHSMTSAADARIAIGQPMLGLLLAKQRSRTGPIIESLLLIWSQSEAEEWLGQTVYLPL